MLNLQVFGETSLITLQTPRPKWNKKQPKIPQEDLFRVRLYGFPPSREWRGVFCENDGDYFARMTGSIFCENGENPWLRGEWSFFVIPAKAGIHWASQWSTSWPTNPTERSTYRRDQQPGKAGKCGRSTSRNLWSSHETASCSVKSSSSTLQIFEIVGFTCDSRLESDNFSPQSAHARLNQRFLQWIQTGPSFLQDFTSLCVLIT